MHKSPSSQAGGLRKTSFDSHDNINHAAAIIGASSAFGKKAALAPTVPSKGNGALLAASLAGKKPPAVERSLSNTSNNSVATGRLQAQSSGSTTPRTSPLPSPANAAGSSGWLDARVQPSHNKQQPCSSIAAIAAAASNRIISHPSNVLLQQESAPSSADALKESSVRRTTFELPAVTLHQASPTPAQIVDGMDQAEQRTDDTPIAPTTSLVKLFEQNRGSQANIGPATVPKPRPPATPASKAPAPQPKPKISPRLEAIKQRQQYDEAVAAEQAAKELRGRPPIKSKPSFKRSSSAAAAPTTAASSVLKTRPELPPPRRTANKAIPPSQDPTKASPAKLHMQPRSSPKPIRKTSSNLSLPEAVDRSSLSPGKQHYQQRSIRQISPHMTGDSLANAIVGAHLASRQTSPHHFGTPAALPPVSSRGPRNQIHIHNPLQHWRTRSNSPAKSTESAANQRVSLRTTMRKEASSSSDEGRGKQGKGRKHRFRKHPNKHHEGDRKRWRDSITERERKRYEGLWAANKGLYISTQTPKLALASSSSLNTLPTEDVLDLVVREIWSRSRLPPHVLSDIWELVDHRGERRLTREEFVVGTWLVDQCLKGRKVPSRVMDSVWVSVRLLGVKVRKKNFH